MESKLLEVTKRQDDQPSRFPGTKWVLRHGMLSLKSRNVLGKQNKLVTLPRKFFTNLGCHTSRSASPDCTSGKAWRAKLLSISFSVLQQIFIDYLLCAKHCSHHQEIELLSLPHWLTPPQCLGFKVQLESSSSRKFSPILLVWPLAPDKHFP